MSKTGEMNRQKQIEKFGGNSIDLEGRKANFKDIELLGCVFRHFKGNYYFGIQIGKDCDNPDRLLVMYAGAQEGSGYWVREFNNFFSEVDFNKYPQADCLFRQTSVEELVCSGWTIEEVIADIKSKHYPKGAEGLLLDYVDKVAKSLEDIREETLTWLK